MFTSIGIMSLMRQAIVNKIMSPFASQEVSMIAQISDNVFAPLSSQVILLMIQIVIINVLFSPITCHWRFKSTIMSLHIEYIRIKINHNYTIKPIVNISGYIFLVSYTNNQHILSQYSFHFLRLKHIINICHDLLLIYQQISYYYFFFK